MNRTILTIELVWKQPIWILEKYKYGLIIKVLEKEFKLLVSRKIPKDTLEKRSQITVNFLSEMDANISECFKRTDPIVKDVDDKPINIKLD